MKKMTMKEKMKKIDEDHDFIWSSGVWYDFPVTATEKAYAKKEAAKCFEHERVAKLKEAALTFYENRKAATTDEVEIDLINILESYWNDKWRLGFLTKIKARK